MAAHVIYDVLVAFSSPLDARFGLTGPLAVLALVTAAAASIAIRSGRLTKTAATCGGRKVEASGS